MNETMLVKYDEACRAVAAAKSTDEAKQIIDIAEAMRVYSRQAHNKAMEIDAAEIRVRAERRLGELIIEQKKTVGLNTGAAGRGGGSLRGTKKVPRREEPPTLADAGILKKLSARAQTLARLPDAEFEGHVMRWRQRAEQTTERVTKDVLKPAKSPTKTIKRRARKSSAPSVRTVFTPDTECYFDVEARLRRTFFDLTREQRAELVELVSQLLRDLEEEGALRDSA